MNWKIALLIAVVVTATIVIVGVASAAEPEEPKEPTISDVPLPPGGFPTITAVVE